MNDRVLLVRRERNVNMGEAAGCVTYGPKEPSSVWNIILILWMRKLRPKM